MREASGWSDGCGVGMALLLATSCGSRTGLTSLDDPSGAPSGAGIASCPSGGPGLDDCGPKRESCCTTLLVQGGTYARTYTNVGGIPNGEADPATVSSFRLDKYEVTVGRFRLFVNAWNAGSGWLPSEGSGKHINLHGGAGLENSAARGTFESGWVPSDTSNIAPTTGNLTCDPNYATWTSAVAGSDNRPITCVNWYEAYAFCIWDGGFLPSEAEWGYAAAGGIALREYPWGATDPGTLNLYALYGCFYPTEGVCTGSSNIAPVGTAALGAGLWGQLDLAGSDWEWSLDGHAPYVSPCNDCAFLGAATLRAVRGGDFSSDTSSLLPADRSTGTPQERFSGIGVRCARSP